MNGSLVLVPIDPDAIAELRDKSPTFAALDALHAQQGASFATWLVKIRSSGGRAGSYTAIARAIDRHHGVGISPSTARLWCMALGIDPVPPDTPPTAR
jgi:hypothetical protein